MKEKNKIYIACARSIYIYIYIYILFHICYLCNLKWPLVAERCSYLVNLIHNIHWIYLVVL